MKKQYNLFKIKWMVPKVILVPAIMIGVLFPIINIIWFLIKINLPFLNAGDKLTVITLALLWWLSASIIIWSWRIKREN